MGLFSRKKNVGQEVPRLPELPKSQQQAFLPKSEIPDVPSGLPKMETQSLPILPDSEAGKEFNQQAIKQAVGKPQQPMPELPDSQSQEVPPIPIKELPITKRTMEMPAVIQPNTQKLTKEIKPIFVRLDKFKTAIEIFEEIKNKTSEIEELLKKTREIKIREEQELIEWEREIQIIKSKIDLIDRNIFNQLD